jgi:hypothetical protein
MMAFGRQTKDIENPLKRGLMYYLYFVGSISLILLAGWAVYHQVRSFTHPTMTDAILKQQTDELSRQITGLQEQLNGEIVIQFQRAIEQEVDITIEVNE